MNGDPVYLGQWISSLRRRRERLQSERVTELEEIGMQW
nr:Helicase associated domain protein [Streptomyces inhibens]